MPAELKSEKKTVTTSVLKLEIEVTDDNRRPLGLAAHAVLEGFAWNDADDGHAALRNALRDIKVALNVRAPKSTSGGDKAAPAKAAVSEKPAKAQRKPRKGTNGNGTHAEESAKAATEGDGKSGTEVEVTPPGSGPAVLDPFAIPAGPKG